MFKCVYCLQDKELDQFNAEHIISAFLGGNGFPLLENIVCKQCNSFISTLEDVAKRDSIEGLFSQMHRIKSKTVWISGENVDMKTVQGFSSSTFNDFFPFLGFENNEVKVIFIPQVKFRSKTHGYQVFPIEELEKILNGGEKGKRDLKKRLSGVSLKDISIVTGSEVGDDKELKEAIALLGELGINYTQKKSTYLDNKNYPKNFEFEWKYKFENEIRRVLAKIAFNYYIYCTLQESDPKYIAYLLSKKFNDIRNFILNGTEPSYQIVKLTKRNNLLYEEQEKNKRLLAHNLCFENKNGKIIATITLFGGNIYEIILGDYPDILEITSFGCGVSFDPFNKIIYRLATYQKVINPKDNKFGLFKL